MSWNTLRSVLAKNRWGLRLLLRCDTFFSLLMIYDTLYNTILVFKSPLYSIDVDLKLCGFQKVLYITKPEPWIWFSRLFDDLSLGQHGSGVGQPLYIWDIGEKQYTSSYVHYYFSMHISLAFKDLPVMKSLRLLLTIIFRI